MHYTIFVDKVSSFDVKSVSWSARAESISSNSRASSVARPRADFIVQHLSRTFSYPAIFVSMQWVKTWQFALYFTRSEWQLKQAIRYPIAHILTIVDRNQKSAQSLYHSLWWPLHDTTTTTTTTNVMDYSAVITQLRGHFTKSRYKTVAQLNADVCWPSE